MTRETWRRETVGGGKRFSRRDEESEEHLLPTRHSSSPFSLSLFSLSFTETETINSRSSSGGNNNCRLEDEDVANSVSFPFVSEESPFPLFLSSLASYPDS